MNEKTKTPQAAALPGMTPLGIKPAKPNGFKCHFMLEKETKGALRYMQVLGADSSIAYTQEDGAEFGTVYLRKSAFKDDVFPKRLVIAVSVVKSDAET